MYLTNKNKQGYNLSTATHLPSGLVALFVTVHRCRPTISILETVRGFFMPKNLPPPYLLWWVSKGERLRSPFRYSGATNPLFHLPPIF